MKNTTLLLCGIIVFLFIIGYSIHVNYQMGYFDWGESNSYLSFYLGKSSFLTKIYDYRFNDTLTIYRPRELGNLFNLIDAYLLVVIAGLGFTNLLSPLHYISLFGVVLFPLLFALKIKSNRYYFGFFAITAGCMYLLAPAPFLSLNYIRASKSVLAFESVAFLWFVYLTHRNKLNLNPKIIGIISGITLFVMGITDEIGIAFAVMFSGYFLFLFFLQRKKALPYFLGSIVGIGLIFFYRQIISPRLVNLVIGTMPLSWSDMSIRALTPSNLIEGIKVFLYYLGQLTGGLPEVLVIGLLLLFGIILVPKRKIMIIIFPILFLVLGMYWSVIMAFMIYKHPAIALDGIKLSYYPVPFVSFWFSLLCVVGYRCIEYKKQLSILLTSITIGLILVNVMKMPIYQELIKSNIYYQSHFNVAKPIIDAINSSKIELENLNQIRGKETVQAFRALLSRPIN